MMRTLIPNESFQEIVETLDIPAAKPDEVVFVAVVLNRVVCGFNAPRRYLVNNANVLIDHFKNSDDKRKAMSDFLPDLMEKIIADEESPARSSIMGVTMAVMLSDPTLTGKDKSIAHYLFLLFNEDLSVLRTGLTHSPTIVRDQIKAFYERNGAALQ